MCTLCGKKVGNRYADQTPAKFRPLIDAARNACNPSRKEDSVGIVAGLAATKTKNRASADEIVAVRLVVDAIPQNIATYIGAELHEVGVFAFESPTDGWPHSSIFEAIHRKSPKCLVLRIMHKNGDIQNWDVEEVLSHFSQQDAQPDGLAAVA